MNLEEERERLRTDLTTEQRTGPMRMAIDPGFVHHRKIETVLGPAARLIDDQVRALPDLPDHLRRVRIDHIYARTLTDFCQVNGIPSLGEVLAQGRGRMFSSTEDIEATPAVYDSPRASSEVTAKGNADRAVTLDYTTDRIASDTLRSRLNHGAPLSVIAVLDAQDTDGVLRFEPLVMGFPWLSSTVDPPPFPGPEWWSYSYAEVFVEDIDQLSRVREIDPPDDWTVMEGISEAAFKHCLAEILGAEITKDWGGETSDLFSANVSLNGTRTPAACLLKGPARFSPMTLNHLGKNNDQIYRLSQEPASLLVVQHCHEIRPEVRATLRAFAVTPGELRRYCCIDGRDSFWILKAHDKVDRAIELSAAQAPLGPPSGSD